MFSNLWQHGRPLYGDVFGVLQQDEPNYDVCLIGTFSFLSQIRGIMCTVYMLA
jgi:hypothetical protein